MNDATAGDVHAHSSPNQISNRSKKTLNKVPDVVCNELAALAARPESDIDFSDLPPTQASDWVAAEPRQVLPPVKQQLTVRIDADVVAWLKGQSNAYQAA